MSAPENESSEPKYGERLTEDMTMGRVVDMLPKDGTPVRLGDITLSYQGSFDYNDDWKPVDQARRMGDEGEDDGADLAT